MLGYTEAKHSEIPQRGHPCGYSIWAALWLSSIPEIFASTLTKLRDLAQMMRGFELQEGFLSMSRDFLRIFSLTPSCPLSSSVRSCPYGYVSVFAWVQGTKLKLEVPYNELISARKLCVDSGGWWHCIFESKLTGNQKQQVKLVVLNQ